jgi:hypothetical protein
MDLDAKFERTGAFAESMYICMAVAWALKAALLLLVAVFIPKTSQLRSNSHFKIFCREQLRYSTGRLISCI